MTSASIAYSVATVETEGWHLAIMLCSYVQVSHGQTAIFTGRLSLVVQVYISVNARNYPFNT